MFDGYRRVTVGTVQETSPMSSEPPRVSAPRPPARRGAPSFVSRPRSGTFSSRCTAFASAWSASLHRGRPTCLMFSYIASATGLLKCCGQAEPSTREVTVVSGHHRRPLRDRIADLAQLRDVRVIELAEVVPDARHRRHDVRLVAAAGDHVMRALLGAQVLAAEVPADVHQLHRVERAAAAPGGGAGVRGSRP